MALPVKWVNVGTRQNSAGATQFANIPLPASRVNGRLLLGIAASKNNETHTWSGTGWTKWGQVNSGASFTVSLAYAIVNGSEATPTVAWTSSVAGFAQTIQYDGSDSNTVPPIGASLSNNGTTSTHSCNGITTTRDQSSVIYLDAAAANTAIATPTNFAEKFDAGSATGATRNAGGEAYFAGSGSTSSNISVTGANAAWVMWQIEVFAPIQNRGLADRVEDVYDKPQGQGGGPAPRIPAGPGMEVGRPGPGLRALQRFVGSRFYERPGTAPEAASGAYTLTAATASFTLTGNAANLLYGHVQTADVTSFTLTGIAAGTYYGRVQTADVTTFSLNGLDVAFPRTYVQTANVTAFNLSGLATGLYFGHVQTADVTTFSFTGLDAVLARGYPLVADPASFTLAGIDAGTYYSRVQLADVTPFTLTGNDALLVKSGNYVLLADTASFTLTGNDAGTLVGHVQTADATAFVLTGNDAGTLAGRVQTADVTAFSLTGNDATLTYTPLAGAYTLAAEVGAFDLTGLDVGLQYAPLGGWIPSRSIDWWATYDKGRRKKKNPGRPPVEPPAQVQEVMAEVVAEIARAEDRGAYVDDVSPRLRLRLELDAIRQAWKPVYAEMLDTYRQLYRDELEAERFRQRTAFDQQIAVENEIIRQEQRKRRMRKMLLLLTLQ